MKHRTTPIKTQSVIEWHTSDSGAMSEVFLLKDVCELKYTAVYDTDYDLMYIEPRDAVPAEYEPVGEDIYLRKSIADGEVIGAMVFDYSQHPVTELATVLPEGMIAILPQS